VAGEILNPGGMQEIDKAKVDVGKQSRNDDQDGDEVKKD
jgi:hypothetical protein